MKTIILYLIILNTFAMSSNIFTIKDKDGNVLKNKQVTHNVYYDEFLAQQKELLEEIERTKLLKEQKELLGELDNISSKRETLAQSALEYNKENILLNAKRHLGEDYVWGGTKPGGFDCSGYMQYLYKKEGVSIPRTAYQQSKVGKKVSRFALQKGDLLFFLTDKSRNIPITHVGMYIGNGKFIHAASKKQGIIISSLEKSQYGKLFVKATRIIQ